MYPRLVLHRAELVQTETYQFAGCGQHCTPVCGFLQDRTENKNLSESIIICRLWTSLYLSGFPQDRTKDKNLSESIIICRLWTALYLSGFPQDRTKDRNLSEIIIILQVIDSTVPQRCFPQDRTKDRNPSICKLWTALYLRMAIHRTELNTGTYQLAGCGHHCTTEWLSTEHD